MSHEELSIRDVASPGPGPQPEQDAAAVVVLDADLQEGRDGDEAGTEVGDAAGRRVGRRRAATASLVVAVALVGSGVVHEVAKARERAALEATTIAVDDALFDVRPLLYARLAGARPSMNVPVRLTVRNQGERDVAVLALQIGDVPVVPTAEVRVPAGGTATVRGLARAACAVSVTEPAPGLSLQTPGTGAARVRDAAGTVRSVPVTTWPEISADLPSGTACSRIVWDSAPLPA